jgi:cytidylate kinase
MSDAYGGVAEQSPKHGYRGEPSPHWPERWPSGITVAVSRESGARGGSIARRVGRKLGWPIFDQEQLEFMAQAETPFQGLPEEAQAWADAWIDHLLRARALSEDPAVLRLARAVLALAAQGEAVLIGRGAGHLLPPATTLHVRIIAPKADRVAYLKQWLRLTEEEAAEELLRRDAGRGEFLRQHLHLRAHDPYPFDMLLNSGRLGEEACADLIVQAAQAKAHAFERESARGEES